MDSNTGTPQAVMAEPPAAPPVEVAAPAAPPVEAAAETTEMSMAEHLEQSFAEFAPGKYVRGRVVGIDKDGVLVDIGYKSDGRIRISELSHRFVNDPNEVVKVGDEIECVVLKSEDSEGTVQLSKKRADADVAWKRVSDALESGETLHATAVEQVKGGLIVDLGLRGFVPASQVDTRPVKDLGDFVGETLELKVLEIDRARRKVVLSRKKAVEEERQRLKSATMSQIIEGQVVRGRVARITNFGAFINLGGVDGLVHISEMSYRRVNDPKEVVSIGEEVDVLVLKLDKKKDRISLSLRQARPDPWLTIEESFKEGQVVAGKVSKTANKFAFVELCEGVEGLVPIREIADERIGKIDDVLTIGQPVEVKVMSVQPQLRRIELSIRRAKPGWVDPEPRVERGPQERTGQFTMAALLKDKMAERGITNINAHLRGDQAAAIEPAVTPAELNPGPHAGKGVEAGIANPESVEPTSAEVVS